MRAGLTKGIMPLPRTKLRYSKAYFSFVLFESLSSFMQSFRLGIAHVAKLGPSIFPSSPTSFPSQLNYEHPSSSLPFPFSWVHSSLSNSKASIDDAPEVYPLSRRKLMLIEEAKKLDSSMASDRKVGSYSPIGWSNRLGSVLTPASIPGVYTADRPFYWNKIDVGCRMTVIQLTSRNSMGKPELIIHSPVGLDPPLIEALDQLGEVAHVVSPNYEHVKYAYQWARQYPDSKVWGCPGMMEREPEVRWTGEIPYGARPPGWLGSGANAADSEMWNWEEFQPLHVDTDVNPFTGRAFFNEVIFYHAPSKTILTTDLYWNYPRGDGVTNGQITDELSLKGEEKASREDENDFGVWELAPDVGDIPLGSQLWKFGMDKIFYPFYMNFMVKNDKKDTFSDIAEFVTCGGADGVEGWKIETIIPAHGDIIRGKTLCRKVFERHFNIHCS